MPHYIALIHKDPDSCYGVSFPDIPGVVTGGDTVDEAMEEAAEFLQFAAEDWINLTARPASKPRAPSTNCVITPNFLKKQKTPWSHSSNILPAPTLRNNWSIRISAAS